jgi:Protein of unknown function (DUF1186)/SEC-C motif
MDAAEILAQLAVQGALPVDALRAAGADRTRMAPVFVEFIERFLWQGGDRAAKDSVFFIFHLLGDWREKSGYRPLARLLRLPPDDIDEILGSAITETSHRVMAAVFDGEPAPLYEVILDPDADEFIRSRMLEAIAMVTLNGELPRGEASRFLRACYAEIVPQDECFVWNGWQKAIALLGLVDLKPLVEQAFARDYVSGRWLKFHHFEEDLQKGVDDPGAQLRESNKEYSLFGDTIEELSKWHCFNPEPPSQIVLPSRNPPPRKDSAAIPRPAQPMSIGPASNPHRNVGRNDPCPCGSGKKFKKCCLTAAA